MPSPGAIVGSRFELLARLGQGGMGVVYKARDKSLDEPVALKLLRPDLEEGVEAAERFRSEIKLARRVGHRNVCRIYEYGEDGDVRYIAMELVEGTSLGELLRSQGGGLPAERAFDVVLQAVEGLAAIHEAGIIHRDLKPSNIMVEARGGVKLMDFGIAKPMESVKGITATGHLVGTPEYMSPEQARGEKLDRRSDVYSMGVILFEVFTGEVPFRGDTPVSTVVKHLQEPPPLDSPRLPGALVPVLRRALAKTRDERYAAAEDLGAALREARTAMLATATSAPTVTAIRAAGGTVPAAEPPRGEGRDRRPLLVALALAVFVVLVGLAVEGPYWCR